MRHFSKLSIVGLVLSLVFCSNAFSSGSSGFELGTNSARSLGRANAVTADPGEPAAVAFNPAGLTYLPGNQVSMSTSLLTLTTDYSGKNGNPSEDGATLMSTVPSFFMSFSTPIEKLKVGGGVNAPFGLSTHYSSQGNFKYTANYNMIKTVAYNLSAAYQVQEWLSIGGGFTYLDASTKQVGKLNNAFILGVPGDSDFELDVSGHGYGLNLGVEVHPAEKHYLGLFYRSQIHTRQTGYVSIDNIPGSGALVGFYNTTGSTYHTGVDTDLTFPGSLTLGYKYQATPKWDVESDVTWTQWSTFDRISLAYDSPSVILNALTPVPEGFRNTLTVNLGTSYKLNDIWTVSGGYWFYEMAANRAYYSNAIPDANRHALTMGILYNQKNYSIGISYVALFFQKTSVDNNIGATNGASVDGDYSSFVNIVSLDAVYRF